MNFDDFIICLEDRFKDYIQDITINQFYTFSKNDDNTYNTFSLKICFKHVSTLKVIELHISPIKKHYIKYKRYEKINITGIYTDTEDSKCYEVKNIINYVETILKLEIL